ncbi:hypothetical protein B0I00_3240 [Novosphingobium kunmingense]|uniref:Lipoprotein n=1 Tax=Novosphingobium kunmingense TaxID=1211806 RepID=A0A2N0H3G9_9SPHN|nr:hypothetical protein [Novosphingobium kunmingense]PKB13440.1 hypothetical protein B0I00_3240 [Novosphingobium kunmingense]
MLRYAILGALIALSGCQREPTFDEAFKANEADLASKAAAIDAELDAAQSDAAMAEETGAGEAPAD